MSDDMGHLALVIAAVNDASTKARLIKLQDARQEIEDAQAELAKSTAANQQVIAGIQDERRQVEAARAALATEKAKFEQDKAALTAVVNAHNDERARWEEQRKIVDAQHQETAKVLASMTASLAGRKSAQLAKQAALDEREAAVAAREAKMERWHSAFEAAQRAV